MCGYRMYDAEQPPHNHTSRQQATKQMNIVTKRELCGYTSGKAVKVQAP